MRNLFNRSNSNFLGVVAGQALSDAYIASADAAIRSRLMYGGYRLSNLIKYIYDVANEESFL